MEDTRGFIVIGVFGVKLPEEVGLGDRCCSLVLQISLDKGGLNLLLERRLGTAPREAGLIVRVKHTNRTMLDGIIRHQPHRLVHMSAIVVVALLD